MKEPRLRCIIKTPDEFHGHVAYVRNRLKSLQKIVGGYIECVSIAPGVVLICNEDGRYLRLKPNCRVKGIDFVGTIVALGVDGEEFADLKTDFEEWMGWLS